jgi:alpha-glucoside transport system substrate-binding protein
MANLPAGTVTFLFTDIEGSTRLLKQLGARYADVLADHQRILRECFDAHYGREVDTQGDSFFVAFARGGDAVASAIDAQLALQRHRWPEGADVRVRMGVHSGEPRASGERYVGFGVHRAARVAAVGHGGQILVSNATRELVEGELEPHTRLRDLGLYRLKDLDRPERLFQVEAEGLQRKFPPLAARRVGVSRRSVVLLAAVVALAAAVAAAAAIYARATKEPSLGSADNPITIATSLFPRDPGRRALEDVLRTFEETTGLHTTVRQLVISDPSEVPGRLAARPASIVYTSPGVLAELARSGVAKPLDDLAITDDALRASYGKAWLDLAKVDGKLYGIPGNATSKSLVWYRPEEFRRMDLAPPKTWAELLSLIGQLKRHGENPWALAAADSWTLTDWFENVYLRTAGPVYYDALFAGKARFDDPSVTEALRLMSRMLSDRYIAGGRLGALQTGYADALEAVFGPDPHAQLYMGGGFVGTEALTYLKPRPQPGRTIGAAPFPQVDPEIANAVVVGADFVVPLAEGDAIRRLLLYLSSSGAGRIWVSSGAIVSPHKAVGASAYPNALVRAEALQLTRAEVVRFDGSDLLPGTLGVQLASALQDVIQDPARAEEPMAAFQKKAARVFETE